MASVEGVVIPVFTLHVERLPSLPGQGHYATWEWRVQDSEGAHLAPVTTARSLTAAKDKAQELITRVRGCQPGSITLEIEVAGLNAELRKRAQLVSKQEDWRRVPRDRQASATAERNAVLNELTEWGMSQCDIGTLLGGLSGQRISQMMLRQQRSPAG